MAPASEYQTTPDATDERVFFVLCFTENEATNFEIVRKFGEYAACRGRGKIVSNLLFPNGSNWFQFFTAIEPHAFDCGSIVA